MSATPSKRPAGRSPQKDDDGEGHPTAGTKKSRTGTPACEPKPVPVQVPSLSAPITKSVASASVSGSVSLIDLPTNVLVVLAAQLGDGVSGLCKLAAVCQCIRARCSDIEHFVKPVCAAYGLVFPFMPPNAPLSAHELRKVWPMCCQVKKYLHELDELTGLVKFATPEHRARAREGLEELFAAHKVIIPPEWQQVWHTIHSFGVELSFRIYDAEPPLKFLGVDCDPEECEDEGEDYTEFFKKHPSVHVGDIGRGADAYIDIFVAVSPKEYGKLMSCQDGELHATNETACTLLSGAVKLIRDHLKENPADTKDQAEHWIIDIGDNTGWYEFIDWANGDEEDDEDKEDGGDDDKADKEEEEEEEEGKKSTKKKPEKKPKKKKDDEKEEASDADDDEGEKKVPKKKGKKKHGDDEDEDEEEAEGEDEES
ncbi:hypothetical protein Pelo_4716 [Pelomyxa schiedti]|nr:hypothetical protein Pelo_4716 [Pelomyxa schiedti]